MTRRRTSNLRQRILWGLTVLLSLYLLFLVQHLSRGTQDQQDLEPVDEPDVPAGLLDLSLRGFQMFSRCIDFQCEQLCFPGVVCCADIMFRALEHLEGTLRKHKVVHYVCFGTALGAVRDHDIISWTSDIDVCGPNVVLEAEVIRDLYTVGLLYFLTSPPRDMVDRAKMCLTPKAITSGIVPLSAKLPGNMKGKTARVPYVDLYQDLETTEIEDDAAGNWDLWDQEIGRPPQAFIRRNDKDDSFVSALERLHVLYREGDLTLDEFTTAKSKLLGSVDGPAMGVQTRAPTPGPRNITYVHWLHQTTCLTEKAIIYPLKVGKIRDLEVFLPRNASTYLRQWYGQSYLTPEVVEPGDCAFSRSTLMIKQDE